MNINGTNKKRKLDVGELNVANMIVTNEVSITGEVTAGSADVTGQATVGSVVTRGVVQVGPGSQTAPSLTFEQTANTGFYRRNGIAIGATVAGSDVFQVGTGNIDMLGNQLQGVGSFICESASINSGSLYMPGLPILCGAITASGDVSYPQYYSILTNPSMTTQGIPTSTWTPVTWTQQSTGSNISFSNPSTNITIPVNGLYAIFYTGITFAISGSGSRTAGMGLNGSFFSQYAMLTAPGSSIDNVRFSNACLARFVAGNTISVFVYQGSGGSLNIGNDNVSTASFGVFRLCA